ncbi:hypothetical protein V1514DRAFT_361204 [Lipomyces japonicus]|uniref:uncharacterized protein n=1 Tax=Lipomyces japonicus TaxID=56871 RepID=UPI0034CDDC12
MAFTASSNVYFHGSSSQAGLGLLGVIKPAAGNETSSSLVSFTDTLSRNTAAVRLGRYLTRRSDACVDPYRLPGMLSYNRMDPNATTWIPYYEEFHNGPVPAAAVYPHPLQGAEPPLNDTAEDVVLAQKLAPPPWMARLVQYYNVLRGKELSDQQKQVHEFTNHDLQLINEMSWVQHRRVLLIGDSIDRLMAFWFCQEFGLQITEHGGSGVRQQSTRQTTAVCHVPLVNLTIVQWHMPSLFTFRPQWWWEKAMTVVPFEERIQDIYGPATANMLRGMSDTAGPDLITFQSSVWDERAFREAQFDHDKTGMTLEEVEIKRKTMWSTAEQLKTSQLRFIAARTRMVVRTIRDMFGDRVPFMYRTPTVRRDGKSSDLGMLSIDRLQRAVMASLDVEVFEWGRLTYGFPEEYKDTLHIARGGLSWLWADMILSYLFRASGGQFFQNQIIKWPQPDRWYHTVQNWDVCHSWLVSTESR